MSNPLNVGRNASQKSGFWFGDMAWRLTHCPIEPTPSVNHPFTLAVTVGERIKRRWIKRENWSGKGMWVPEIGTFNIHPTGLLATQEENKVFFLTPDYCLQSVMSPVPRGWCLGFPAPLETSQYWYFAKKYQWNLVFLNWLMDTIQTCQKKLILIHCSVKHVLTV